MKLGLIMLAAGNSRRFGSNKLLYGIDGMPMYRLQSRRPLRSKIGRCRSAIPRASSNRPGVQSYFSKNSFAMSSSVKYGAR